MPETQLIKHEDGIKLTHGMTGKLAIEVHVYDKDPETALTKAFEILNKAKRTAITEGYTL